LTGWWLLPASLILWLLICDRLGLVAGDNL